MKIAQDIYRKDDVDVLVCVSMIVMMMSNHQFPGINVRRNDPISQIAQLVLDVETFLVFQVHAAGGYDRDGAFCQLAIEGSKRNAFARECRHKNERPEARDQRLAVSELKARD